MAFKINGTTIDLSTVTSTIDFNEQIVPFSRGCSTAPTNFSFTDDQRFLRERKVIAQVISSYSLLCHYYDNYGLEKRSYRSGTVCCHANYIVYTNNWRETNSNVPGLADNSNHSQTLCHARYIYNSGTYGATRFMCYENFYLAGDGIKILRFVV